MANFPPAGVVRSRKQANVMLPPILRTISLIALLVAALGVARAQTPISGVINLYTPVTGMDECNGVRVASTAGFATGDTVLIIQMKGAQIDKSTRPSFGTVTDFGAAGTHEIGIIDFIDGNTVFLRDSVLYSYDPTGKVQLVRVPHYTDALVTGPLTAPAWDNAAGTGGVIAIDVSGTLTLAADIDASGKGFRGGAVGTNTDGNVTAWTGPLALGSGGEKGEGIALIDNLRNALRAPLANGGGGGNAHNAGGGGGGNLTAGGKGGFQYSGAQTMDIGGHGGYALTGAPSPDRIFLGGGGGGGHQNDNQGTPGTAGGGIIVIRAGAISGNWWTIQAQGIDAAKAGQDGAGGGGAGGTIAIETGSILTPVAVGLRGGRGGNNDNNNFFRDCHGTGGGGAGGVLRISMTRVPSSITVNVSGGGAGQVINTSSSCYGTTYGAEPGNEGVILTRARVPQSITPHTRIQLDAGPDRQTCGSDSVQLQVLGVQSVHWSPSDGLSCTDCPAPRAHPSRTTTYRIEVPGKANCYLADSITVTVRPGPTVSAGKDTTICPGDSVALRAGTTGSTLVIWSPASSVDCPTCAVTWGRPTKNTVYSVLAENEFGCTAMDSISVTIAVPPPLDLGPDQTICPGDSITLTAIDVTEARWTPSEGLSCADCPSPKASPSSTTVYRAVGRRPGSCAMNGSVTVTVRPRPALRVMSAATRICLGDTVELSATGSGRITWATAAPMSCTDCATTRAWPTSTTTFVATLVDANGCTNIDSVRVDVAPLPTLSLSADTTICAGGRASLRATSDGTLLWSPSDGLSCTDCAAPVATPSATRTYHVTARSADGCLRTDSVRVGVDEVVHAEASIGRGFRVKPGSEVTVPVLVAGGIGPKQQVDTVSVALDFEPSVLLLKRAEAAGGILDGWTTTVTKRAGRMEATIVAPPGTYLATEGPVLYVTFAGFVGRTDTSELPVEVSFPGSRCLTISAKPGLVTIDSICGLSYRLIEPTLGGRLAIGSIRPNPFNPSAEITFTTPVEGRTRLEIVNVAGQVIARPVDEELPAGEHTLRWDATTFPSGLYFCRLGFGDRIETRSMLLVK